MDSPSVERVSGGKSYLEQLRFLQVTETEKQLLRNLAPRLQPRLPEIIDRFYEILQSSEPTTRSFLADSAVVQRLKAAQQAYFENLFTAVFDESYVARRIAIGRMHEKIGLEPRWYIGGYDLYCAILFPLLRKEFSHDPEELEAAQLALLKAFFLDMQIVMETYIERFAGELIEARRALEQKLWIEDRLLYSILEKTGDAIVGLDEHDRISTWSQGAQRIFGYKTLEILEKAPAGFMRNPEDFERLKRMAAEQGTASIYASEWVNKEGRTITADATMTYLKDEEGVHVGSILIVRDTTEIRRLATEVKNMEQIYAMTKITAGVAHEIRTPLGVLTLTADMLQERVSRILEFVDTPEREQTRKEMGELLSDLQVEVERLDEIVNHYLVLSRIKKPSRSPIHLKSYLQDFISEVGSRRLEKEIRFQLKMDDEDVYVNIDPDHFRHVFLNLFDNSQYAILSRGEIDIAVEREQEHLQIAFQDTGIGIPRDRLKALFSPFVTNKPGGTGLGLYLVREIVEAHDGRVRIESREGYGTTVIITLPTVEGETENHGNHR